MIESMILGYRYMMYSAQVSMGDDYDPEEEETAFEKWVGDHFGKKAEDALLVLAAVLYAAVFGLTDTFVSWFNSENSVQMAQYAHIGMRMYFVGYFFAGFNIMAAGYLSAVNRPAEASITSICRGMVAIVACSLVLSAVFGMPGVWAAFPASELLTALLTLFLLRRKKAETA